MTGIRSIAAIITAVLLAGLAACTASDDSITSAANTAASATQTAAVTEGAAGEEPTTGTQASTAKDEQGFEGITVAASPEVVRDGKLAVTVSYNGSGEYYYGESYSIEKEANGEWVVVEPKEAMVFIEIAYLLSPESQGRTQHIDLDGGYGSLPAGSYRIAKSFSGPGGSTTLYAPFTVA